MSTNVPPPTFPVASPPETRRRGRGGAVVAVIAVVLTVGAIALAAAAPSLSSTLGNSQSDWSKVYDKDLANTGPDWSQPDGCFASSAGLAARGTSSATLCTFAPSTDTNYLSRGFQLDITLAPGTAVEGDERALIVLGNDLVLDIEESGLRSGDFVLCQGSCGQGSDTLASGGIVAWHTDNLTANVITLRFESGTFQFFANGQEVSSSNVLLQVTPPTIQLGTGNGAEALYTHMTLTSATPA